MLDRRTPPAAQPLAPVRLPDYQSETLSNGLPVYLLPFGNTEVVEVQVVFRAGTALQPAPGVASRTARLMLEGTAQYDSLALAQLLDGHGAWLHHEVEEEALAFKLDTVTTQLAKVIPLLAEVVLAPSLPEEEWTQMQARDLGELAVNEQKTSYLARRRFGQLLYGADHPYGASVDRAALEAISLSQLRAYQQEQLQLGNAYLTVIGQFESAVVLTQLDQALGQASFAPASQQPSQAEQRNPLATVGRQRIERPGMQATVRMGHLGLPRSHPDFYRLTVVNTILGGYFGSRLMKNIREEKGYTYGIYSAWAALKHGGHLVIQADTGTEYVESLIEEVKREIRRLGEEGVQAAELDLVKNYLLGRNLSQRETAFQLGDLMRHAFMHELSFAEIDRRFDVIQAMQPDEVAPLVRTYFKPADLLEVVVGS
jgi:zinc protease